MRTSTTSTPAPARHRDAGHWWGQPALLAVGTFVVGTDAFVIAGLLPDIGRTLHVSVGAAGQLVSVFSIAYALLSPVLATVTAHWQRRRVLPIGLLVLALGNVATAASSSYGLVLAARVLAAAGAAMFTANASATAAQLAGEQRRGRAIAIVIVGLTSSLAFGAPLGTAIGDALGWQATMLIVAGLAVVVAPVIALRLPLVVGNGPTQLRQRLAPLTDRGVLRVIVVTLVAFTGVYLPYTYISVVFASAIAGHADRLAVLLLVFGVAGTLGNLVAGRLADRFNPALIVRIAGFALTVMYVVMLACRSSYAAAVLVVGIGAIASWSITGPQQHRVMAAAPSGTESLAMSLNAAVLYLAVSLSGVLGALALRVSGSGTWLLILAAVFTLVAAVLARGRTRQSASGSSEAAEATLTT